MASEQSCTPLVLPPIMTKTRHNIRPNNTATAGLIYDPRGKPDTNRVKPLRIAIQHGRRKYDVVFNPVNAGVREEISMRHLAEKVHDLTNVKLEEQRFLYKGVTWESTAQNIGQFSPLLRQLGIKNGDKVHLVSWPIPVPDHASVESLKTLQQQVKALDTTLQDLMRQMEVLDYIFGPCVTKKRPVGNLRENFQSLQEKYSIKIQIANSLIFDHRNLLDQTSRRELVDDCQKQMDKCFTAASRIFDRLVLNVQRTSMSRSYRSRRHCRSR